MSSYVNNNQLTALFIFSLFSYHTSTHFGFISSPSSWGRIYMWQMILVLLNWLSSSLARWQSMAYLYLPDFITHLAFCEALQVQKISFQWPFERKSFPWALKWKCETKTHGRVSAQARYYKDSDEKTSGRIRSNHFHLTVTSLSCLVRPECMCVRLMYLSA